MAGHRRSLSDSLLLDENVSGEKYFHEEDGIGGANIHFNKQKRNKGLDVLKLIENDTVQVLTKYGMKSSMSMDSLDQSVKFPNEMWKDSYEKLFNAKVKKFMTGNQAIQENKDGFHNRSKTGHSKRLASDLSNSHLMDFPAADCKSKVTVAAFLQNADRMRLTPYAAEPAYKFGASMSYDAPSKFHSDLLLQGHDLMRVEKIKADTASDVDNEINLHGGMFKDPKIDLGISTPDSNLALPNTKGAPVINLTKGSFKGPKAEIIAHNIDMDVPSSKFKRTKLKLPKFNFPGFNKTDIDNGSIKGSKLEVSSSELGAGLNYSNIQVDGTKADLKGLKTNLTLSDMDMPSGKLKMPTFNLPDFGLSRPKIKMLDNELKTPEMDLSSPKIDTDFNSPDFNIRGHKLDITAPEMNVDIPKGKINGPNLKKPNLDMDAQNLDINAPSGKLNLPKFGLLGSKTKGPTLNMNFPELNLQSPKIKGGLDISNMDLTLPQSDLKGPNLDISSPDIDVNGPSGKLNMPKLKMPSFGLSGLKGPHMNVEADIDQPDINLNTSTTKINAGMNGPDIDINGPNADTKGPKTELKLQDMDMPSGKLKTSTFNMPNFGLSGPKTKTPEMDQSASKIKADLNSPDFNTRGQKPDITAPDMNVDIPKGTFKGPNLNKPSLDVNAPDTDINASSSKLKMPKFGFSGSKPKGPNLEINYPELNLKSPKIKEGLDTPEIDLTLHRSHLKGSNLDINSPDMDVNSSGKLKLPKLGKLQASRSRENLDMTHSNMGMNPMRVSPQIVDNAGKYGRSPKIPKGHYTTDDICYNWKGMPRGDGRGNRQTEYGQTSSGHRQTIRGLQSHAMDLEVPESTLKVSRRFNPLTLIG